MCPTSPGPACAGRPDGVDLDAHHCLAEVAGDLGEYLGVFVEGGGLDDCPAPHGRVSALEDPGADEYAVAAQLHHHGGVRRGGDSAGREVDHREAAQFRDLAEQLDRGVEIAGGGHQLVVAGVDGPADVVVHAPHVGHRLDHVPRAGLAFCADHRRTLSDTAQCLAEVPRSADEGGGEGPLVDVVLHVGRSQYLGLVDIVDSEALQYLRLDEVAYPRLGHHRYGDRLHDLFHSGRVGHPGDPAVGADVGRHSFESHDGHRPGLLGDAGLVSGHDIHDDATLQHLGEPALDTGSAGGVPFGPLFHGSFVLSMVPALVVILPDPGFHATAITGDRPAETPRSGENNSSYSPMPFPGIGPVMHCAMLYA